MKQEKIWEYYQSDGVGVFSGSFARLNFLANQLNSSQKVLNIGIGSAEFERLALSKSCVVSSLDPSEKAISKLQEQIPELDARVGYSQEMPFDDAVFDVVVMSEVLEHLDDEVLAQTISEVYRVLKNNGVFIGTVPFDEVLEDSQIICPACGEQFHRWGHIQTFTKSTLLKQFPAKFSVKAIKPMMFHNWRTLNWKGILVALFTIPFFKAGLAKKGATLYFEFSVTK